MPLQQLANQLQGLVGGGSSQPKASGRIERTLDTSDMMSGDVSVNTNSFVQLASYQVGAKQLAEIGQGDSKLDPQEQGRPEIKPQNSSPTVISGVLRIRHEDPNGEKTPLILERKVAEFNVSTRSERIVLPRASSNGHPKVSEDGYLRIYMKADSSDTISKSDTTITLPVTLYNLNA